MVTFAERPCRCVRVAGLQELHDNPVGQAFLGGAFLRAKVYVKINNVAGSQGKFGSHDVARTQRRIQRGSEG